MLRKSRIEELWNDDDFMKEVIQVVSEIYEKDMPIEQKITWIGNYWADDDKGAIGLYVLGNYPVMSMIENK